MTQSSFSGRPANLGEGSSPAQGNSPEEWMSRGESAFLEGNLDEARRAFEKALLWRPFDARVHSRLSRVLWRQNLTEECLHSLTRALELDPDDQEVILQCNEVFRALGKKEDAREILEAYLNRRPWDHEVKTALDQLNASPQTAPGLDAAEFFNQQGEGRFHQGKFPHARACFEMAIEHNPRLAKAHSNLGVLHLQEGNLEQALECLHHALECDPEDADVLYNSAKALMMANEDKTASEFLQLYLQRHPEDADAWEDYAAVLRRMASFSWQPDGLAGEVSSIYLDMGRQLAAANDHMGAIEAFHRAVLLDPQSAEPFCQLGQVHLKLDHETDAIYFFGEGLNRDPSHRQSLLALGRLLTARQAPGEARDLYESYLKDHEDSEVQELLKGLVDASPGP